MAFILLVILILLLRIVRMGDLNNIPKVIIYSFLLYWFGCLIACTFSPFNIIEVSVRTYIILSVGIISLFYGLFRSCKKIKNNKTNIDKEVISLSIQKIATSKKLLLVYIPIVAYCLKYALIAVSFASINNSADMSDTNSNIYLGDNMAEMIVGYICTPLFHMSMILLSYTLLNFKKIWRKCILHLVLFLSLFVEFLAISGSKSQIITLLIYLLITYLTTTAEGHISLNFKKMIYIFSSAIVIWYTIIIMLNYRSFGEISIENRSSETGFTPTELIGRYSVLPIVMFDQALESGRIEKYGRYYGRASLAGIDSWVSIFLNKIGINYTSSGKVVDDLQNTQFQYSKDGRYANYAYTAFFYNYVDFGYLGIIVLPFIFGIAMGKVINRFLISPCLSGLLLVSITYFMLMHSIFTCYLIKGWVILYIIVLLVINRHNLKTIA